MQSCSWEKERSHLSLTLPLYPLFSPLLNCYLLLHFSLGYTAAHFCTFHPLIHSFQPDPNLKLLCKKSLITIKWLNIKCPFQTISQTTSWEHLTLSITIRKRWVSWGSLMNCEASLPFHMLALFAIFFPSLYLSQWKATYPSQSLPLNPNKINSCLLSATSHAPCSCILCVTLCGILWHCLSLGLKWKLIFQSCGHCCFPSLLAFWVQHFHNIMF